MIENKWIYCYRHMYKVYIYETNEVGLFILFSFSAIIVLFQNTIRDAVLCIAVFKEPLSLIC